MLVAKDNSRFQQLSKLTVSDLIKTLITFEKLVKTFTNGVAHTEDHASTLKLSMQHKTNLVQKESRLHAYEEVMRREGLT